MCSSTRSRSTRPLIPANAPNKVAHRCTGVTHSRPKCRITLLLIAPLMLVCSLRVGSDGSNVTFQRLQTIEDVIDTLSGGRKRRREEFPQWGEPTAATVACVDQPLPYSALVSLDLLRGARTGSPDSFIRPLASPTFRRPPSPKPDGCEGRRHRLKRALWLCSTGRRYAVCSRRGHGPG